MPCMINLIRFANPIEDFGPVWGTALTVICMLSLLIFIVPLFIYFNQINRLNKLIKELGGAE